MKLKEKSWPKPVIFAKGKLNVIILIHELAGLAGVVNNLITLYWIHSL